MWRRGLLSTGPQSRLAGICISISAYIGAMRNQKCTSALYVRCVQHTLLCHFYDILLHTDLSPFQLSGRPPVWLSREIKVTIGYNQWDFKKITGLLGGWLASTRYSSPGPLLYSDDEAAKTSVVDSSTVVTTLQEGIGSSHSFQIW
jgi:hypothetical protein